MNIDAFTARFADWLKAKFFPVVFAGKDLQGFIGGALSSIIAASVFSQFASSLQDVSLDAQTLKKLADDGLQVVEAIPFEVSPNLIPEKFRFLAPLLFDMSLPDPSIKVRFKKEDVYSIIDYLFPATQTTQVSL